MLPEKRVGVPVLFLVFNRPELTRRVWRVLRMIRPERLYVAADGPRAGNAADFRNCAGTRRIVQQLDWPCDVKYRFLEKNYGCRRAVSSAIDWFFSEVEEGIILEDDCLPCREFFSFCAEALKNYRHDARVMHVNGTVHFSPETSDFDAWFSRYAFVWGWASWRRAWKMYDPVLLNYPFDRLSGCFPDAAVKERWDELLRNTQAGKPGFDDTWAFQWSAALFANGGLAVSPRRSLIRNIGLDSGTHEMPDCPEVSFDGISVFSGGRIRFPPVAEADAAADALTFDRIYRKKALPVRIADKLRKVL
ncbi:MAG: nucleotide-diphospho-sugar transferase [Lentisphaeria bacterium]|nr:nucleotide-diphospho-sugar transferase [Lentisphaeria bacterium]